MNPSLFVCAGGNKSSELDVARGYGGNVDSARMSLEMHWDSWIKEEDFAYLQKIGELNRAFFPLLSLSLFLVFCLNLRSSMRFETQKN